MAADWLNRCPGARGKPDLRPAAIAAVCHTFEIRPIRITPTRKPQTVVRHIAVGHTTIIYLGRLPEYVLK